MTPADGRDPAYWLGWQQSWDRQQERFLPDREERFSVLSALIGTVSGGEAPRVLDLACGCGSISSRVLERFPRAELVAADIDPVLLQIAAGVFEGDSRVTLAEVDLRREGWASALPGGSFDAVVSATALHWLAPERLASVYQAVARLLRPGGLFADADHVPLLDTPLLDELAAALEPASSDGEGWEEWWARVALEPEFEVLLQERGRRFGGELHPEEFTPGPGWHVEKLSAAGFAEAGVVWRRGRAAVVAALR